MQARFLVQKLREEKIKTRFIKFPQYEKNYWGGMAAKYLRGEFGKSVSSDAYLPSMFYALDRWESAKKISSWLKNGYIVVCDRYADSNKIHQLAKLNEKQEKLKIEKWLDLLEYDILKIPRPDIVVYLDMPIKFAFKFSGGRNRKYIGRKKDIHEADIEHLRNARKVGLDLCKKYKHFIPLRQKTPWSCHGDGDEGGCPEGMKTTATGDEERKKLFRYPAVLPQGGFIKINSVENGRLFTPEEIHKKIWSFLKI